ncbi:TPA: hypothetical protein L4T86_005869 [Pseudomonas aeruginosa]|nr:hypothetical protein [Pseudomonas aeruginosa]
MSVEQADQTPENLLELDSSTLEEIIDALSAGGAGSIISSLWILRPSRRNHTSAGAGSDFLLNILIFQLLELMRQFLLVDA